MSDCKLREAEELGNCCRDGGWVEEARCWRLSTMHAYLTEMRNRGTQDKQDDATKNDMSLRRAMHVSKSGHEYRKATLICTHDFSRHCSCCRETCPRGSFFANNASHANHEERETWRQGNHLYIFQLLVIHTQVSLLRNATQHATLPNPNPSLFLNLHAPQSH